VTVRILVGDVRERLREIPDESVHCIVTSPPYWGLRDYGVDGQLGLETDFQDYIEAMVAVFAEARRVLRQDGTLWLNLGDCYANDGKWGGSSSGVMAKDLHGKTGVGRGKRKTGLKPKDLMMMPARVVLALQEDGWWLRSEIVWAKPNPMPESVVDRPTSSHEKLFLLTRSERYFYDADAVREPAIGQNEHDLTGPGYSAPGQSRQAGSRKRGVPPRHAQYESSDRASLDGVGRGAGRNLRNVWTIATSPFQEAHFATFPPELPERCIKAGCPAGGTVLDPFGGAGTTALVADRLKRHAILIELNPDYAEIARKRLEHDAGMFAQTTMSLLGGTAHDHPTAEAMPIG